MKTKYDWDLIDSDSGHPTSRLRVPNGWIVNVYYPEGMNTVFVPDEEHSWDIKDSKEDTTWEKLRKEGEERN